MIVCAAVLTVLVLVNIVLTYFVFVAVCDDVLNAGWRQWTIAAEHFAQHLKDTP